MNDYMQSYDLWLKKATDRDVQKSLRAMDNAEIKNAFSKDLSFGTGGLRGVMSAGTDRMNVYTVYRATEGLAQYMLRYGKKSCAVTYDSRLNSKLFSQITAATLASHGIKVYVTKECMPTPFLSFIVRLLGCDTGVNVTASHNPSAYNGYKVYDGSGCQLTDEAAEELTGYIGKVDMFACPLPKFTDYEGKNITYVDGGAERKYIDNVAAQSLGSADGLTAVYTPLNGAGYRIVPETLRRIGLKDLTVVKEQSFPDGNFVTCPYPNPEKTEALEYAKVLAEKTQSDIVIANDPDSDRLGVMARDGNKYVQLSGNEVGVLMCDYILSNLASSGKMPQNPIVVKTIVTSKMVDDVCAAYGAEVKNVLTGFKYIGDVINKLDRANQADRFVFGFEESCGYLKGTYVRDKDGVVAAALIAECAAFNKRNGKTLCDRLRELYAQYGDYLLVTVSYRFEGADGAQVKQQLLTSLRNKPFTDIAGSKVTHYCDYLTCDTGLPKSNVMQFNCEDGSQLIIRPSGTEPLIKCYMTANGSPQSNERRIEAIKSVLENMFLSKNGN